MTSFIAPRTGAPEITLAEEQHEYKPLTAAIYQNSQYPGATVMLVRVTFTDEERALIFAGEDLYISQLNFGHGFSPMTVEVGPQWWAVPKFGYEGEDGG